eukprot:scaffold40070_cov16-Tisochrysis_lutea.AAC.1
MKPGMLALTVKVPLPLCVIVGLGLVLARGSGNNFPGPLLKVSYMAENSKAESRAALTRGTRITHRERRGLVRTVAPLGIRALDGSTTIEKVRIGREERIRLFV